MTGSAFAESVVRKFILILAALGGTAASAQMPRPPIIVLPAPDAPMTPREAVERAAAAAPAAVPGEFALTVRASGRSGARVFLNSERDYRDQRNLTISIDPAAASMLAKRYGAPPGVFFRGKAIRVRGAARRTRISFNDQRGPTGLYYYQTHVRVIHPNQIELAPTP